MALVNVMEQIVDEEIEKALSSMKITCDSEQLLDIKALSLNALPSKYVNTKKGQLFVLADYLSSQNTVDIKIVVLKAINIALNHPRNTKEN